MKTVRKKTISFCLIILLLWVAFAAQAQSVFAAGPKKPDISARGAVVYCQNTGEVVYSKNIEYRYSPYSTTKLMTVLLAAQNLPLDQEVTISEEAAAQIEASMHLKAGEVLTVKELIYGAMLPSGNDAAYALGEAVSGNIDDFVKLMNRTAENIGCENTKFKNANGMKVSGHLTTPYDMMLITRAALSNDVVRKAAGSTTYTVRKTNKSKERKLKTHIDLLKDKNSGVYAGKTGYWDNQNSSIALGYRKNGLELYIVLMGADAKERTGDVKKLIQYATEKIEGVKVVDKDSEQGKVRIKHGAKTRLKAYTSEIGYAYLPKEGSRSLIATEVSMNRDVEAPVRAGTVVGKVKIYVADEQVNEVALVIKEDVETGWFTSYLGISNLAAVIIAAAVILIFCFFIWVSAMKAKTRRRKKRLRQQRIMEMAREELYREQERRDRDWRF